MTSLKFAAHHKARAGATGSGYETEAEARAQCEFLASTYGGVAKLTNNREGLLAKYSAKRGWH